MGTSKGELLKLAEATTGTMVWQNRVFPRSTDGEVDVPEALPAQEGLLPHLHTDWEDRFPRAEACKELEDRDPEGDEGMEARGRGIGIERGTSCGVEKAALVRDKGYATVEDLGS